MRLTTFTDFGLRALMLLADDPDRAISTAEIADKFSISRHHLTKAMATLSTAGFITTQRGSGGGARLARPAKDIKIGEVVRVLEQGQSLVECFEPCGGSCAITSACRLKSMLAGAEQAFLDDLNQYSLADCKAVFSFSATQ
ncbi:MAG: Rrf2 family transcriptional regulator [Rhodobacteraceae bacterium]|nr:Rrf2 family transcriptional regulator [Paracoccaceae bacterium]